MWGFAIKGGWKIVALIATAIAGGASGYAYHQRRKRVQERANFNSELHGLSIKIGKAQAKLERLTKRFGVKNQQVRELAQEIRRLRAQYARKSRAVA